MATTTIYGAGAQIQTNITDIDALEAGYTVEVDSAGDLAAPNVLAASESRSFHFNEDTLGETNYYTLPTAAAGLLFTFVCNHTDGVRVVANTGDTIRVNGSVSIAAGYVESTTVGSVVQLIAMDDTEWHAVSIIGTWAVETS